MKHTLLTILVMSLIQVAHSSSEWISLKRMDLFVNNSPKWLIKKDLLGFPLVLVSKSINGQRSSLSFTPSAHKDVAVSNLKDFEQQFDMYKSGRNKWLREREGQLVNFINPVVKKYSGVTAGIVGFEYKLNDQSYVEYSINIFCQDRYVFSKLLYSKADHPNAYDSTLSILKDLKCRSKQ